MNSLEILAILFVVFATIYGVLIIYVKTLLKNKGFSVTFFFTEISDYRALYKLGKQDSTYLALFYLFVASTVLPLIVLIIMFLTIM